MLEGSHGMARDAEAAVALLEEKVKDGDIKALWMLGVCCEFGMGTEQGVARAEQLYKRGAALGNATTKLLMDKLKNRNGRGCTQMDLQCEQEKNNEQRKQKSGHQQWLWTGKYCGVEGTKVMASMMLMHVPLTTLNLGCETITLLEMIMKEQKTKRHMIV